jgi:hypothetical protein
MSKKSVIVLVDHHYELLHVTRCIVSISVVLTKYKIWMLLISCSYAIIDSILENILRDLKFSEFYRIRLCL